MLHTKRAKNEEVDSEWREGCKEDDILDNLGENILFLLSQEGVVLITLITKSLDIIPFVQSRR